MVEDVRDDIAIPSLLFGSKDLGLPAFTFPLETCFSGLEILVTLQPINFLGGANMASFWFPDLPPLLASRPDPDCGGKLYLQVWAQ